MEEKNYQTPSEQLQEGVTYITETLMPDGEEDAVSYSINDLASTPGTLLPNPGEGGPVSPGQTIGDDGTVGTPIITLPSPGTGGAIYPGNNNCTSNNCGNNNNNSNNNNWNNPAVILPNIIGTILAGTAKVRFLNAAYGYPAFRVVIGNNRFVNLLNYASASSYGQIRAGYRTVSIVGTDGYIYIQKTLPFSANSISTIAIINSASGMDLLQITDQCCPPTNGYSSFRIGNLAYNSGPLDVLMSDGRVVYSDLRFKEIGAFKRIMPGTYQFFYADTNMSAMPAYQDIETLDSAWLGVYPSYETFGSLYLNISANALYSVYILQSGRGRNNIQNLILMDR